MSRTFRYKLVYIATLLAIAALVLGLLIMQTISTVGLVAIAVALLVPGRIGGYYLKNLFLSRKLIDLSRFDEAVEAGQKFLEDVQRQPWRRHFIYCFFGLYTWDVEAMARNNIGAAHMHLGDIDKAESHFQYVLEKDPDYPLPYMNLAIISCVRGNTTEGDKLRSIAAEKGYSGGPVDRLISKVGGAYSHFQGRA
jgi:tetratricopeptide (TPR) repeat protein